MKINVVKSEAISMCDAEKYNAIYQEIKKLTPEDTTRLILECGNEDECYFYAAVGNYLLQRKQHEAIERNIF